MPEHLTEAPAATPPLTDGWTIYLHTVHNLTILTLLDCDGAEREIGFHPLTSPGTADLTVRSLEEIIDPDLRTRAQALIISHFQRIAKAQANAQAFGTAVPDLNDLTERLSSVVPGCRTDLDLDRDALTVVLTLAAERTGAGRLLSLINSWPGSTEQDGNPSVVIRQALCETAGLTVTLDQARAERFLTWYREQP